MSDNNEKRDLELREWTLVSTIAHFKDSVEKAEAELQEVVEALKAFATTATETVVETAEVVVDKVEEVVEVVKEEVKKAAPKKATSKKVAKAEETPAEEPETDK
jgi:hypothetical protein